MIVAHCTMYHHCLKFPAIKPIWNVKRHCRLLTCDRAPIICNSLICVISLNWWGTFLNLKWTDPLHDADPEPNILSERTNLLNMFFKLLNYAPTIILATFTILVYFPFPHHNSIIYKISAIKFVISNLCLATPSVKSYCLNGLPKMLSIDSSPHN